MVVTVADAVLDLKHAVIDDFQDLIEQLHNGHQPENYQCILNRISFIQNVDMFNSINVFYECLKP